MTKIEAMGTAGQNGRTGTVPTLYVVKRSGTAAKVVAIDSPHVDLELIPPVARGRLMGRKGRQALAHRRALDGALLTVAVGVVALLWWSTL